MTKSSLLYHLLFISAYQLLRLLPLDKASLSLNGVTASTVVSTVFSSSILTNIFVYLFFRSYLQLQFHLYPDVIVDYAAFWGVILLVNYMNIQQHALEYFCFVCTCTVTYGLFKRSNIDIKIWAIYGVIVTAFHTLYVWSVMTSPSTPTTTYILSTNILTLYLLKDTKDIKRLPIITLVLYVCWLIANSIFNHTYPYTLASYTYTYLLDGVKGLGKVKMQSVLERILAVNRVAMQSLLSLLW
ncbi:hypothetical protein EON65_54400 [archaeon]|nr:MAG: hypothetical protein EON65_54400 [archaeon]